MKINKEFVKVYDGIFNYIFKTYGLDGLIKFWKGIAPVMLADLKELVIKDGVKGCEKYWNKVLKEEGAGFRMNRDGDKLQLEIYNCPSVTYLNAPSCPEYCRHCPNMIGSILESAGLKWEFRNKGGNRCEWEVYKEEIK